LGDVATPFMIAAMGKDGASLFQNEIHVGNRTIIQSGHGTTSPGACDETTSFASDGTALMITNSGKSGIKTGTARLNST
jgi:hypothetical protein